MDENFVEDTSKFLLELCLGYGSANASFVDETMEDVVEFDG